MGYGEGMTPADVAAVTNHNNGNCGGMWGGDFGSWIILFLIFGLFGFGGGGFGGFGGGGILPWLLFGNGGFGGFGGNCREACATQADVRAAVDQQTLISKLDQQTYGLADSTYALRGAISDGFHGVDSAICNLGYQNQAGFNGLSRQLADCCCETRQAIGDVKYTIAQEGCETRHAMCNNTRDIIDNANANSRAILDFLVQDKISTLTAENQSLKFAASQSAQNAFITANQQAQTAELIRRLGRDCPVPAYVVPNPNCCYQYAQPACGCGQGNF
jgi:hypothetical protein